QPVPSSVRARTDLVACRAPALGSPSQVQELDKPERPVRAARAGAAASLPERQAAAQRDLPAEDVASPVPRSAAQAWRRERAAGRAMRAKVARQRGRAVRQ